MRHWRKKIRPAPKVGPLRRQNARDLKPILPREPAPKMQKIIQNFQTKVLKSKNQHLESEKQDLEKKTQDLENENKEIKSKNEDLQSENKDLKKQIQQSADGIKLSRMPRSRFTFRPRILPTSGLDKVEREIIANIATLKREKQDLEGHNKKIEDTIASNIRQTAQDDKDKQNLQILIKSLERKKQDLERQVPVTDRFIDTARQTVDDEKVRRDPMTVIKVLEREKQDLEREKQDLEKHNHSLRMQNQQMNVRLAKGEAGSFREKHVIADRIEDDIRQELEAEQVKRELQTSIKALEQEQQYLERQKQDMMDEKKSLDDKLVVLRKWVERLESKSEELKSSIKDLPSEVQTGVRAEEVELQSERLTTEFLPSACNGRNTEPVTDKASRHVELEKLPQDSGNTIDEHGVRASLARSAYIETEPALHNKKLLSQQSLKGNMDLKEKERKHENMDYRRRMGNASAKIDTGLKRARK